MLVASQKSAGLAAVLSAFWPGLGQIYNGQIFRGLILMCVSPIFTWLGFALGFFGGLAVVGKPSDPTPAGVFLVGLFFCIAAVVSWIYGTVNAYRTAERINQRQLAIF